MNASPEGTAGGATKGLIDYVEFPAPDLEAVKRFYRRVFGWSFEDFGPEYTSFTDGRLSGGFYQHESHVPGGALVVLRVQDLAEAERRVREAGGVLTRPVFSFPGGSRFHFRDPGGNELAPGARSERGSRRSRGPRHGKEGGAAGGSPSCLLPAGEAGQ